MQNSFTPMPDIVMVNQLSTERLLLTPVTYKDAADIFDLFTDKKVLKNYGIPPHKNLEESKKLIRLLTNNNHFSWGIRQKNKPDKLIGLCSLHDWHKAGRNIEIGCTLSSRYWGLGFMQEAFRKLIDYAADNLQVKQIIGKTTIENGRAIRLVEKLGFVQWDTYAERQADGEEKQVVILVKEV
jgi:[ribosomal protein S5]-alanine N-acetyltransferase